jgi:type VI secretion system protein VasD
MTNIVEGKPYVDSGAPMANAGRREMHRKAHRYLIAGLLPVVLSACSVFSSNDAATAKEPVRLEITIQAADDLNVDLKGRGAPMLLRVYELKSDVAFQEADYFGIQNTAKAVLGADLLNVDQFIIRPGESRDIKRRSNPETMAIGIFAGYRDLPNAVWRVVQKLPLATDASWYRAVIPSTKVALKVELQANAILVVDKESRPKRAQVANESSSRLENLLTGPTDATSKPAQSNTTGLPKAMEKGSDGTSTSTLGNLKERFSAP